MDDGWWSIVFVTVIAAVIAKWFPAYVEEKSRAED